MTELTERMRRAARAIYLATDAAVADDISAMLREAADLIDVSLPVLCSEECDWCGENMPDSSSTGEDPS